MKQDPHSGPGQPAESIEIVRSEEAFALLEPHWDRLYAEAGGTNPFLSFSWTRACRETVAAGLDLFVITIWRAGLLTGIAPLCIERRLGFRTLRFIGDGRSDYLGFLAAPDGAADRLLMQALSDLSGDWDIALLRQLATPFTKLHQLAPPERLMLHCTQWTSSAYCDWEGDWESLHGAGPPWLREMRKRRRKFNRDGGTTVKFTGAAAIAQLGVVAAIERNSWKGREAVARLQPGPGQQLLGRAFDRMAEAALWLAFSDDRAVAFQVAFRTPQRLWLYQASYDERFARTRAGSVLAYVALEEAWANGAREYDYLAGEEPYKLERTSKLRPIHHLAAHTRKPRGWLAWALLAAPRWKLRRITILKKAYEVVKLLATRGGRAS